MTSSISSEIKTLLVDEQIMIMTDISNNQDVRQNFAYVTQVRDENNVMIPYLS